MAATIHEVVWGRLLGNAVGNTAWGVGLALTVFMVGMGLGALGARRLLGRSVRPRRAYVVAEVVIGLGALAADAVLLHGGPVSRALGEAGAHFQLAVDLLGAAVVTLPAALAMGATYPLLTAAALRRAGDARLVSSLYRSGLGGGVLGVLLGGVLLAPRIGVDGAALVAAGLNLLAAFAAWRLLAPSGAPAPAGAPASSDAPAPAGAVAGLWRPTMLFAAAGVVGLGAQAVWNRVVVCYAGVSTFSFSAIVAVYLVAQYAGMAAGGRTSLRFSSLGLGLAAAAALASLGLLAGAGSLVPPRDAGAAAWLGGCTLAVAAAVGPAAFLLGVAQAGALRLVEEGEGDWARAAAWVSGAGTVSAALAAAVTALVLVPAAGPRGALAILGGAAVLTLALAHARAAAAVGLAVTAGLFALAPGPRWFLGPAYDAAPVLHAQHDVQDTIAIIWRDLPLEPRIRRLVANGMSYSGDSLFAQRYMRLLGHLPALAAQGERRALVICVGTGTTAAALRAYGYERIDAVDLSPSTRVTLSYFHHVNGRLEQDPRVHLAVADGDRFLGLGRARYDVITLEPPPPRAPGGSTLYTREFYERARARLAVGGVLAQWLPLHDLSSFEARAIVATFLAVFPSATLHLAERNEAVLLGGLPGSWLDAASAARRARRGRRARHGPGPGPPGAPGGARRPRAHRIRGGAPARGYPGGAPPRAGTTGGGRAGHPPGLAGARAPPVGRAARRPVDRFICRRARAHLQRARSEHRRRHPPPGARALHSRTRGPGRAFRPRARRGRPDRAPPPRSAATPTPSMRSGTATTSSSGSIIVAGEPAQVRGIRALLAERRRWAEARLAGTAEARAPVP